MAALPYMPLYVADYMADAAHLTTLEHGAYLLLIMNYWQRGKPLPDDDRSLANITRLSIKKFQKIKFLISKFFILESKTWVHPRIEKELNLIRQKSENARQAGLKSGKVRKNLSSSTVQFLSNGRSTNPERTLNHTDTDTDTDKQKPEVIDMLLVTNKISTCPTENAGNMTNFMNIFLDDYPQLFIGHQNRSRCTDLFRDWLRQGVTPEDVIEAVKWKKSEGGEVNSPLYYKNLAVRFADARRQNRPVNLYNRKKTHDEQIQDMIKQIGYHGESNVTNGKK